MVAAHPTSTNLRIRRHSRSSSEVLVQLPPSSTAGRYLHIDGLTRQPPVETHWQSIKSSLQFFFVLLETLTIRRCHTWLSAAQCRLARSTVSHVGDGGLPSRKGAGDSRGCGFDHERRTGARSEERRVGKECRSR